MSFVTNSKLSNPTSLRKGTGGCNPCFKPSNEASKADLVEMHVEDMRIKKAKRSKPSNKGSK